MKMRALDARENKNLKYEEWAFTGARRTDSRTNFLQWKKQKSKDVATRFSGELRIKFDAVN